jgi:hypothetical protein
LEGDFFTSNHGNNVRYETLGSNLQKKPSTIMGIKKVNTPCTTTTTTFGLKMGE